ncbi:MAG TPA: hypothetical protein VLX92_30880 [Kofleriaceae bacterium]|nr:hypothetical protein [Kofleriaceae bacterium]
MTERDACALLKARFEKAGYRIAENVAFDEHGVRFEIDGYDAARRVGYEYLTDEAGDGWDVDADVIAALAARRDAGELFVLVVDEADAPDAATLGAAADTFLHQLAAEAKPAAKKPAAKTAAAKTPAAKTAAAKTPAARKPAARKPAAKKAKR